jgi:hypothetical protein
VKGGGGCNAWHPGIGHGLYRSCVKCQKSLGQVSISDVSINNAADYRTDSLPSRMGIFSPGKFYFTPILTSSVPEPWHTNGTIPDSTFCSECNINVSRVVSWLLMDPLFYSNEALACRQLTAGYEGGGNEA